MLILVRHGQTADNAAGLLLGRADPSLSAEGEREASALASLFAGAGRVVASPLGRTLATAEAIASRCGCTVSVDERWVELDYGELDRQPLRDVPAAVWSQWQADASWAPPGGESLAELGVRVRAACTELLSEAADTDVVVVTHVSPIKAAVAWALGTGDEVAWRLYVAPASITRIGFSASHPVLRAFNDTSHLAVGHR